MARLIDISEWSKFLHKKLDTILPESIYDGGYRRAMCDVDAWIAEHTIEAEPVLHGRWLGWGKGGTPTYENYGTCSICHEDAEIHTEHRNYCPNCGAKMDGDNHAE